MNRAHKTERLVTTVNSLPEECQDEVLDFAEFLASRTSNSHQSSDKTLAELAGRLKNVERDNDTVVSIEEMNRVIRERGGQER